MSMFSLAIFCLTTTNLPWLLDLTFQVPMQYCSLWHWTLHTSPVTSTAECCFCFWPVSFFFLELFPHHLLYHFGHLSTWRVHLSVSYIFGFSCCSWSSKGKNIDLVCHSLHQWSMFYQNVPPRQEYTEELYKKYLHDQIIMMVWSLT